MSADTEAFGGDEYGLTSVEAWALAGGFGNDEQPCAYCEDEPGTHDPVLGYACAKCKQAITQGTEDGE